MPHRRFMPWRALTSLPHITVRWAVLPAGVRAATDGKTLIELNCQLTDLAAREALAHELVHIERQHQCGQSRTVELQVRAEVARRLVPLATLGDALAGGLDLDTVARDVWVTRAVLNDRLSVLTDSERAYLDARTDHHREAI